MRAEAFTSRTPAAVATASGIAGRPADTRSGRHAPALPSATWLYEPYPAPEVSLPDLDGKPRSLSALRGRPVVLLFWASHAPASRAALQELATHHAELARAGAALLAVALDPAENTAAVRAAATGLAGVPVTIGTPEVGGTYGLLNRALFVTKEDLRLPTAFLLNAAGRHREGLPRAHRRRGHPRGPAEDGRDPGRAPGPGHPVRGNVLRNTGPPQLPPVRTRAGGAGLRGARPRRLRARRDGRPERLHPLQPRHPLYEERAAGEGEGRLRAGPRGAARLRRGQQRPRRPPRPGRQPARGHRPLQGRPRGHAGVPGRPQQPRLRLPAAGGRRAGAATSSRRPSPSSPTSPRPSTTSGSTTPARAIRPAPRTPSARPWRSGPATERPATTSPSS